MRRITESGVMRQRVESTNAIQKVFSLKPTSHYLSLFEAYRLRHHTAALGPLDLRISRLLFSNPFPLLTCTFAPDLDANYTQDPSACLQPHNGIYFLYDANLTTVYTFFTTPKCLPRNLESSMSALVESKETGAPGDHPVTFKRRVRLRCSSRACS